jgi:hypothetical protein
VLRIDLQEFAEVRAFRSETDVLETLDIFFDAISDFHTLTADIAFPWTRAVAGAARAEYLLLLRELLFVRFRALRSVPERDIVTGALHPVFHPDSAAAKLQLLVAYQDYCMFGYKEEVHRNGTGLFALVDALFGQDPENAPEHIRRLLLNPSLGKLKMVIKDTPSLRRLEKLGAVTPDASLIPWLLTIPRSFTLPGPVQIASNNGVTPIIRRQIFRSLAYILIRAEGHASSSDLLLVMMQKVSLPPLRGHAGLVRLLLFFGADPTWPDIANFVPCRVRRDVAIPPRMYNTDLYRGLNKDIVQVTYWRRWIDRNMIKDLPPEVSTEIMLRLWEEEGPETRVAAGV